MSAFRIQASAGHRLDAIYTHTRDTWGEAQADAYIKGLFARFQAIVDHNFPWRAIPADFGLEGFVCRYEKHFIYWRLLPDGSVGIATILHERMHQIGRLRDDIDGRTKSL